MDKIMFSIVVVTLNAEYKINKTLDSILCQTYRNFEILIKDGGSKDQTIARIPIDTRIKLYQSNDTGIYDAMNQSIEKCSGDFIIFLNAGDVFNNAYVLENVCRYIKNCDNENAIFFGDYKRCDDLFIQSRILSDFKLFRKPLCHQTIFYSRKIFKQLGLFNTDLKISADQEFTLKAWTSGIKFYHTGIVVAEYEGEGISETINGHETAIREQKKINRIYFGVGKYYIYTFIKCLSLPKLRMWITSKKSPSLFRKVYMLLRNYIDARI